MELKELFKFLKKYKASLFVWGLVFGFVGALFYYLLPPKYVASGSFYVTRAIEPVTEEFSYEGYYAQQSALSYTKTFMGLLESVDSRSKALDKLNLEVTSRTLRKYGRQVRVKSVAPQLLSFEVKDDSPDAARNFWLTLSDVSLEESQRLNMNGDSLLRIIPVSDSLVVREVYRNVFINIIAGFGFGIFSGVLVFATKEYLA